MLKLYTLFILPVLPVALIIYFIVRSQRKKEYKKHKDAILKLFKNKYTSTQLDNINKTNPEKFRRLYKQTSDKFLRMCIEDEGNRNKSQKMIVKLKKRISRMRVELTVLEKRGSQKYVYDIQELRSSLQMYESIYNRWQKAC